MLIETIQESKAGFKSLTESIDTTTPAGCMMMQMVGSFAEFEREMLRERTLSGLRAARQQGRTGGRRCKLTPQQQKKVICLAAKGKITGDDAARLFGAHP